MDYDCPACGTSSFPSFVPNAKDKLVVQCVKCRHMDETRGPAHFTVGIAAMPNGDSSEAGWKGKTMVHVDVSSPAPQIKSAATHPPRSTEPSAPTDVISMIERRAMWLGAEEARLDGELAGIRARIAAVRGERKKLDRMLRVARRDEAQSEMALRPSLQSTLVPMNN